MKDKTIAILENRASEQMADLVRRQGGKPFSAPALAEIPDMEPGYIEQLLKTWQGEPPDFFIFQTGVGVKALLDAADSAGITEALIEKIESAKVVVRSPKPAGVLRSRKIRIDFSGKDPYTTAEVLGLLQPMDLSGRRVVVQRYGETNLDLQKALQERGAIVSEIASYRWSLPEDTQTLVKLMDALDRGGEVDVVAFTSASQANNLFHLAEQLGRTISLQKSLEKTLIASIGPVCTTTLKKLGIRVDIEPDPPKLGPFIVAINNYFSEMN